MDMAVASSRGRAEAEFPGGGGETGARLRDVDWFGAPLGPPDSWPVNLRTSVGLCLNCSFPMLLFWGPEFTTFFNDATLPILGEKGDCALASPARENLPELWKIVGPLVEQALATGKTASTPCLPSLGGGAEQGCFSLRVSPIHGAAGCVDGAFCSVEEVGDKENCSARIYVCTDADPGARSQSQEQLRESEARLKLGAEVAGIALAEVDYATDLTYLSVEAARMFGLGDAPLVLPRATMHALAHPDDKTELMRRIERALDPAGEGWFSMDLRIAWPNGEARWLRIRCQIFFKGEDGARRPERSLLAALDITAEKAALDAARRSKEFLAGALNSLPQQIAVLDHAGVVRMVNEPWMRFARENGGAPNAVSVGANYLAVCDASARMGDPYAREALEGLEGLLAGTRNAFMMEYPCDAGDGSRWFVMQGARSNDGSGGVILSHTDFTAMKKAEAALRESEERLRLFIEYAPVAVAMFDHDMHYLAVSRRWLADFGVTEPVLGRSHYEVFPNLPERWREAHRRAFAGEVLAENEDRFVRADRTVHWVRWEVRPWLRADGAIGGIVLFTEDITERRKAEEALRESEGRFRALAELNPDAILVSLDGHYVYANQAAARLLSARHASEIIGRTPFDIVEPSYHDLVRERIRLALEEQRDAPLLDYLWRRLDGTPVDVEVATGPISWRGKPGVQVAAREITARKRAEDALREAARRKDVFIATLAHELRNPLAPISNAVHVLRKSDGENSTFSKRDRALLAMMERQTKHLVRLVDDLMEISRITSGKFAMRKQRIDLAAILHDAVDASRPLLDAQNHELRVELCAEPLLLDADHVRLTQVFSNLLNNAVKYTETGGIIRLKAERRGDKAVVSVSDNGLGVPAELLPQVFELFTQVDRHLSRAQGGLGIGLALARNLVQLHGGEIEAQSGGPGKGSRFVVTLPLARQAEGSAGSDGEMDLEGASARRVLVIDDDRDVADSLALLLETFGVKVRVAYDGPGGLDTLADFRPELVFLDLGMPGMDGYETARRIRQSPEGARLTLVALSGWGQLADRHRTQEAGFDRHLTKPADIDAVQDLLGLPG